MYESVSPHSNRPLHNYYFRLYFERGNYFCSCAVIGCDVQRLQELSHTLTILRQNDVPLHTMHLHLQMDNASSTNKNATVFFFISTLVQVGIIASGTVSFLRVGHTHEDTWQAWTKSSCSEERVGLLLGLGRGFRAGSFIN